MSSIREPQGEHATAVSCSPSSKKRKKCEDNKISKNDRKDPPTIVSNTDKWTIQVRARESDDTTIINEYGGYSLQKQNTTKLDVVPIDSVVPESFFEQYVSKRRPCIIDSLPLISNESEEAGKKLCITRKMLHDVAGNKTVQVEKRFSAAEHFGQNRTSARQILTTLSEFLRRVRTETPAADQDGHHHHHHHHHRDNDDDEGDDGEMLYLSTQEDDVANNNADQTDELGMENPFKTPCRQLLDAQHIPKTLELAGNMILSACNLWIGKSSTGSSSGLHHDYHDNFYLLLRGTKRFRLYSPDCAPNMYPFGRIERVHFNGRISYVNDATRADGVPLDLLSDEKENEEEEEEGFDDENSDDDEEEEEDEVVLGKGFDYESSDSSEEGLKFDENAVDDFDEIMLKEGNDAFDAKCLEHGIGSEQRPNHFSRVDPHMTDKVDLLRQYPLFECCKECIAEVKSGQMLYLPAGWFHEVTSFSGSDANKTVPKSKFRDTMTETDNDCQPPAYSDLDGCHVALNYWYHPPDALDNFNDPYKDDFWRKRL